ncbi:MAG: DUF3343 domain-containing protein [Ruminococcaceae bacterium]|nr:DUF3343 domain-containing protein [Oscillospiraceae bacterium]
MEKQLLLVPSVTYAMKAKNILDRYKLKSYIERTPKTHQVYSCGYCLFVPQNVETAYDILLRNGIKIIGRVARDGS